MVSVPASPGRRPRRRHLVVAGATRGTASRSPPSWPPGAEASYVQADITDVAQAVAAVETTVRRHGRIDSLVNSAGLTTRGTLLDTTEELFDQHSRSTSRPRSS